MKKMLIALIACSLVQSALAADLNEAFQKGLLEEEANHNLEAAIQAYQSAIAQFEENRKIAATAVFRLGEVYRKLGRTNEANRQYQRILSEFADQTQLAELSRKYARPSPGVGDAALQLLQDRRAALEEEIRVVREKRNQLESHRGSWNTILTLYPDQTLSSLLQKHSDTEQKLAAQKKLVGEEHLETITSKALLQKIHEQLENRIDGIVQGLGVQVQSAEKRLAELDSQIQEQSRFHSKLTASLPGPPPDAGFTPAPEELAEVLRLKVLIQNSPDLINGPNADGKTPLALAAEKSHLHVAKFLFENGADVQKGDRDFQPLHFAARNGHKAMVELLLAHNADVNARHSAGGTALHLAATKGFVSVAQVLLQAGANVNAVDNRGQIPLHQAALNDQTQMVDWLIEKGSNLDAESIDGYSPLHLAANRGYLAVIQLLLEKGAKINLKNNAGRTPLHEAAVRLHPSTINLLLKKKADVNAQDNQGETALHCIFHMFQAGLGQRYESAKILLEYGADPNRKNKAGATPIDKSPLGGWTEEDAARFRQLLLEYADRKTQRN